MIVSFMPANNRVEQQAFEPCQKWAMWQQGGSVQSEAGEHRRVIETLKHERDNESNRLARFLELELPQMKMEEDVLYVWHDAGSDGAVTHENSNKLLAYARNCFRFPHFKIAQFVRSLPGKALRLLAGPYAAQLYIVRHARSPACCQSFEFVSIPSEARN